MRRDIPSRRPVTVPVATGRWVLEMPFSVPLSLNDRQVWAVKAKAVKAWRGAAWGLARNQRIPPCRRITVELLYVPRDDRARDPLNLVASLKACEDGLVDAGIIPDDSSAFHTSVMPVITRKGPPRPGGNRIWLVITAV